MRDYSQIAQQYASDCISGNVPACKWTRLACHRHLDDLTEQQDQSYPWVYDPAKADRVCKFVEAMPHVSGRKWSGKKLNLEAWQVFILCVVFGWVSRNSGLRRYRKAYIEVAKGNGKSFLSSAVANYMLALDGEPAAEVYSAATTRDQAKIVFTASQRMLRNLPELRRKAGIMVGTHAIYQTESGSSYKAISSDAGGIEGIKPYLTVIDELHAHGTRDLYDNLDTANGKRDNSLLWTITTAGTNRAGICYEQHEYVKKVLDGIYDDQNYFAVIYTADEDDDPFGETAWRKANPNWGVSVSPDDIRQKAHRAKQQVSLQPAYKTKHVNVWCSVDSAWMDMQRFQRCADPELDEKDFAGQPCVIGTDLASKLDLAAMVRLFWKECDGKRHYYVFGTYWAPEARIEVSPNASYKGWSLDGYLTSCDGETNDYDLIEEAIRSACKSCDVRAIAHDPYQAVELVNHLSAEGLNLVEVPQLPKYLSEGMKEVEAAVYDGRFHYDGHPVLSWAMSNVVAHPDKNDNLFPNKARPENKIDPVSALVTAMSRLICIAGEKPAPRRTEVLQWSLEELDEVQL